MFLYYTLKLSNLLSYKNDESCYIDMMNVVENNNYILFDRKTLQLRLKLKQKLRQKLNLNPKKRLKQTHKPRKI